MEVMMVNAAFETDIRKYRPGEVYVTTPNIKHKIIKQFQELAEIYQNPRIVNSVSFDDIDRMIQKATHDGDFTNLIILRSGGIGDLIALSTIVDYFGDCKVHFVTQKKYFPLFDWFENKPVLYDMFDPFLTNFNHSTRLTKYNKWARLQAEGVIENGHNRNWMELFYEFIGEKEPNPLWLRPDLKLFRINNIIKSNIDEHRQKTKSLLICNKATAMMRTCHASDIIEALPDRVLNEYDIFVYGDNLSQRDLKRIPMYDHDTVIIGKTGIDKFLLDCYDADMVISVDTGALHFREGIRKPAIGIYNSFTVDSRCKYYKFTDSFDIKSNCELMPCFLHETAARHHCPKGRAGDFAAPCFDSKVNKTLHEQLKEIFENHL